MTDRRRLLSVLAVTATSGCAGRLVADRTSTVYKLERGSAVSTDASSYRRLCEDGDRLDIVKNVTENERGPFRLSTERTELEIGSTLSVRLLNRSRNSHTVGVPSKFDIRRSTGGEWQSIYRYDPPLLVGQSGVELNPGEGFSWRLRLTQEGVTNRISRRNQLVVPCESLVPGAYQFVFWGVDEPSLAVSFRIRGRDSR